MRGGITGKGFLPGHVSNPHGYNGRDREIMREIMRQTKGGRELVARLVAMSRGQAVTLQVTERDKHGNPVLDEQGSPKLVWVAMSPQVKDVREATIWLLEKVSGKPRREIEPHNDRPPFMILLRERPGAADPLAPKTVQVEPASAARHRPLPRPPTLGRPVPSIGQVWDGNGDREARSPSQRSTDATSSRVATSTSAGCATSSWYDPEGARSGREIAAGRLPALCGGSPAQQVVARLAAER